MIGVLLDTSAVAALLFGELAEGARAAISAADLVGASAISFYEIHQKVRLGKWPMMEARLPSLADGLELSGVRILPVDGAIAARAAGLDWDNRDPFDRIIVSTALRYEMVIATSDRRIADRVKSIAI
jgi:PIN domain nuclease of toxin-antitoxin system